MFRQLCGWRRVSQGRTQPLSCCQPQGASHQQAWQLLGVALRERERRGGGGLAGHWNSRQLTCSCGVWLQSPVAQVASSILAIQGDLATECL